MRLQKEDDTGDTRQHVRLVRVVFKINVCFSYKERKTITRIHWDHRFGRIDVVTHAARS